MTGFKNFKTKVFLSQLVTTAFVLFLNIAVPEIAEASTNCQSETLCVHTNMPASIYQGSPQLIAVLNSNGIGVNDDRGYCAPTASYLALKVVRDEARAYPASWTPLSLSNPYEAIFHLGNAMGTDWINGGTLWSPYFDPGTAGILAGQSRIHGWAAYEPNETYTVTAFGRTVQVGIQYPTVAGFKSSMPSLAMAVRGSSANSTGHLIALNGVEGGSHKIFDPWQRIYNLEMSNPYNVLKNPSAFGYVMAYGGSATLNGIGGGTREAIIRSPGSVAGCMTKTGQVPTCWGGASGVRGSEASCYGSNICPSGTAMQGSLTCTRGFRDIPAKISGFFTCHR